MNVVAEGRDAVLAFLENEALSRTNDTPGICMLYRDDANHLVLTIEGFSFIGSGTISIGGNLLDIVDGHLTRASKPS